MTQPIKALYDAILAAKTLNEMIVVKAIADGCDAAMLCTVSMDDLEIAPLALIYGDESMEAELVPLSADHDLFLHAMKIKASEQHSLIHSPLFRN